MSTEDVPYHGETHRKRAWQHLGIIYRDLGRGISAEMLTVTQHMLGQLPNRPVALTRADLVVLAKLTPAHIPEGDQLDAARLVSRALEVTA